MREDMVVGKPEVAVPVVLRFVNINTGGVFYSVVTINAKVYYEFNELGEVIKQALYILAKQNSLHLPKQLRITGNKAPFGRLVKISDNEIKSAPILYEVEVSPMGTIPQTMSGSIN